MLHVMGHLMERQLDPSAGYLLQKDLERRGIKVHVQGADQGDPRAQPGRGGAARGRHGLRRRHRGDGGRHPARDPHRRGTPASRSPAASSSTTPCAPPTRRSSPIGECVEHDGIALRPGRAALRPGEGGGEDAARRGGRLRAGRALDQAQGHRAATSSPPATSPTAPDREEIVFRDAARGVYKRLVLKDDAIVGAVMYGDTADGAWFFSKIKAKEDVSAGRDTLIFGPAYAGGAALDPMAAVAALPDEAEICGCNGVCKGKIVQAITAGGLTTLDEVRARHQGLVLLRPVHRPRRAGAGRRPSATASCCRRRSRCASAPTSPTRTCGG